eukprot:TRINITY_DN8468_c0_g1_i1.p1 TRINITY_DN8468_c0_g1~~TRINITY_DN8468_c0_g1_i1.p1  ORF type:complete len:455 (+),score=114.28 TRINITY_DN8468_c0_g1_i1:37-1401(+)
MCIRDRVSTQSTGIAKAGADITVNNFGGDLKDARALVYMLSQIDKKFEAKFLGGNEDTPPRAEYVIKCAEELNCAHFVTADDIIQGRQNLMLAFVATLFHKHSELMDERAKQKLQQDAARKLREDTERKEREAALAQHQALAEAERKKREEAFEQQRAKEKAEREASENSKAAKEARLQAALQESWEFPLIVWENYGTEWVAFNVKFARMDRKDRDKEEARVLLLIKEMRQKERQEKEAELEKKRQSIIDHNKKLEEIREAERLRYIAIRKEEEAEKRKAALAAKRHNVSIKAKEQKEKRAKKAQAQAKERELEQLEDTRESFPVVLILTSDLDSWQDLENHLATQGRNVLFTDDMSEAKQLLKQLDVCALILTGMFDTSTHEQLLKVISHTKKRYPKVKLICADKHVRQSRPLQQKCKRLGVDCVRRGQSLCKLLGVKALSLKSGKSKALSFN